MEIFQVSRGTIYNWMNDWEEYRLLGLYDCLGRGRKPIFNEIQELQIKEWVKQSPKDLKKVLVQHGGNKQTIKSYEKLIAG